MRTALDTNILSALWTREKSTAKIAEALGQVRLEGLVVLSPVAHAESRAVPGITESTMKSFFERTGILVDFRLDDAVWIECGRRFARYAERRRKSHGGEPRRLVADYLVGAHALIHADRLMTLDPSPYRQDFPELQLYPV